MLLGIEASIRCEKPEFGEGCIPVHLGACFEIGEADMPSVAFQDPWRSGRGLIVVRVRIALSRAPLCSRSRRLVWFLHFCPSSCQQPHEFTQEPYQVGR